ncbi:DUF1797 family protein [Dolosicoccus paucivorans]|uniref:DUF1797 domain-containing protein n=1 Tax=Dolosicoccus paucivorans TaxID=84521 RepID=A0A1G8IVI6_9LACT|nr:DUF1797 family protein [Dolosicoccus paucivorans]PMB84694.1 DUF1797 domain-containing protein [Dolosicoccus paucivorans]PMC59202.1 DUF1797 domain-containing protein [Dolosicoccus paucivorans]SDI22853.1 Uncharacterized protein YkuJ [Dolosicoccus paucivorans]
METSVLISLVKRLMMMKKSNQEEVRHFEMDGVERAQVTYNPQTELYTLSDHLTGRQYLFDNVDLVAIDLYELLG